VSRNVTVAAGSAVAVLAVNPTTARVRITPLSNFLNVVPP
jgi:hypothetical protein